MNFKTLFLIALFLTSPLAKADNFMMIMGGGGEPEGKDTIFDSTMKTFGDTLKTSNWRYQVSFNGGHPETEAIMTSKYNKSEAPVSSFTADSYKKMISEYKAKILMGEIKSGDQLMIMVNTHGAAKGTTGKTHLIAVSGGNATTDLNQLSGTPLVSMDDLEELVKLTNEKGIKLGIVDLSCHSGNTMALKTNAPNTCIITATGPKHYGYAGDSAFTGKFVKNLKKGETLESAFLAARAQAIDASFPMISTDENDQIVAEVYAAITPYLYYYDPKADKLSDYLIASSKDCVACTRDTQFKVLIDKITALQSASSGTKSGFNGEELKKLLTDYKAGQDAIIRQEQQLGVGMLTKTEAFVTTAMSSLKGKGGKPVAGKFSLSMSWSDIIRAEPDKVMASISKFNATEKDPGSQASAFAALEGWKAIKEKQTQILTQYPQMKDAKEQGLKIAKSIGQNRDTAEKIALQEKKFYDEMYRQKQSLNSNDPCRKIIF